MKFRYSMQKLVDLKKNEKSHAEWMLSKAIGQLHEEESHLEHLEKVQRSTQDKLLGLASQTTTAAQLSLMQDYVSFMNHQIDRKHQDVQYARQQVTDRQVQLTEKVKEEKVWEKAKQRAYEKFALIVQKKEQDEMDEIASIRRMETI
jgi:flagellar protein FliJ